MESTCLLTEDKIQKQLRQPQQLNYLEMLTINNATLVEDNDHMELT